jgi:hypothetical protein
MRMGMPAVVMIVTLVVMVVPLIMMVGHDIALVST